MKKKYISPELDYIICHTHNIMNMSMWDISSGNYDGVEGEIGTDRIEAGWT